MLRKSQDADTDEFVVKILLLPNYRVKYCDYMYIVKWCSDIASDWCASMGIAYILALINWWTFIKTDQIWKPFSRQKSRYKCEILLLDGPR